MMFARRGLRRARTEAELHPFRRAFCEHFQRLEREHGITHYLAHNMTVTPRNIGQVAEVTRACRDMGFRMLSFQPAAFVGNTARWKDEFRAFGTDELWAQIEAGAGGRLHQDALHILLRGMDFAVPPALLAARVARALAGHPAGIGHAAGWARRFAARAGGVRALRADPPRAMTYVVHAFMDASDVRPAWEALQRGEVAQDPAVRATQERLQACSYAMAHPEDGTIVPACAQHAVLDPAAKRAARARAARAVAQKASGPPGGRQDGGPGPTPAPRARARG